MANRVKLPEDPATARQQLFDALLSGKIELPEAIKRLRRLTGETQVEFAKRYGIAERTYVDFERGRGNPTWETLKKISAALGVRLVVIPDGWGFRGEGDDEHG